MLKKDYFMRYRLVKSLKGEARDGSMRPIQWEAGIDSRLPESAHLIFDLFIFLSLGLVLCRWWV